MRLCTIILYSIHYILYITCILYIYSIHSGKYRLGKAFLIKKKGFGASEGGATHELRGVADHFARLCEQIALLFRLLSDVSILWHMVSTYVYAILSFTRRTRGIEPV